MECQAASALIPGYVDGELSEAQASPLRQHLMDCAHCRGAAQDLKGLREWFAAEAAPAVPPGFAERVARRAFAGDTAREWSRTGVRDDVALEPRVRSFVVSLTALAAGLLLVISLVAGARRRPSTDELRADDLTKEAVLERLDELNQAELEAAEKRASEPARDER